MTPELLTVDPTRQSDPLLQDVFGTASLGLDAVLFVVPFPFLVWGADELRRWLRRRHG
jgi:hypothetical protein